jgi:hypothetical protein
MAVLSFLRGLKSGSVFRVRFMSEMTSSKVKSASIANNKRNQQHMGESSKSNHEYSGDQLMVLILFLSTLELPLSSASMYYLKFSIILAFLS